MLHRLSISNVREIILLLKVVVLPLSIADDDLVCKTEN